MSYDGALALSLKGNISGAPWSEDLRALEEKISFLQKRKRAMVNHLKYQTVGINHSVPYPLFTEVKFISMETGIRNSNLWETLCLLEHMDVLVWFSAKSWICEFLTNAYMLFLSLSRSNVWIIN